MRRPRRWILLPAAVVAAAGPVVAASVEPPAERPTTPKLVWVAPSGCPDQHTVKRIVDAILDRRHSGGDWDEPVSARAEVTPGSHGRFRLHVETTGPGGPGRRELEDDSCKALAEVTALVIALALDIKTAAHHAAGDAADASQEPLAPAASGPAAVPPPPVAEVARPADPGRGAQRSRLRPSLRAALAVGGADLPGVSGGADLRLGARRDGWSVEATFTLWKERRAHAPAKPTAGAEIGLATGGLRACLFPWQRQRAFGLCTGVEGGRMSGRGFGASETALRHAPWLALSQGLIWQRLLTERLGLWIAADVVEPVYRPNAFFIENVGPVHEPAPVAARGFLGVEFLLR